MNLTGKKLLILGATSETEKLVQTAETMGIETYVVDPYENAAAKQYSSHPVLLDCFDVDGVCDIVKQNNIDGILPGCADVLIPVYEQVCSRLNKHCYVNKNLVETFNNKKGLKNILRKFNLPVINEYSKEDVEREDFHTFPVFIKPVDNNSSKGMFLIDDLESFRKYYDVAMSFSRSKTVLIEEYKTCDDFYVGFFLQEGNVKVAFTGDRYVINQPGVGSITAGIVYPSKFEELYFETVHEKMVKMFHELNFTNGICAIQGFVEDGKIMFYDPALRITGGQEYMLCKYFYDVDELKCLINYALTGKMSDKEEYLNVDCKFGGKYGCNLTFSVRPCTIGKINGLDYAKSHAGVLNITQEHQMGDVIDKIGTAQQNFARMHIHADSREELRDLIVDLQMHVVAYDNCGNNAMLKGLDPMQWYQSGKCK